MLSSDGPIKIIQAHLLIMTVFMSVTGSYLTCEPRLVRSSQLGSDNGRDTASKFPCYFKLSLPRQPPSHNHFSSSAVLISPPPITLVVFSCQADTLHIHSFLPVSALSSLWQCSDLDVASLHETHELHSVFCVSFYNNIFIASRLSTRAVSSAPVTRWSETWKKNWGNRVDSYPSQKKVFIVLVVKENWSFMGD